MHRTLSLCVLHSRRALSVQRLVRKRGVSCRSIMEDTLIVLTVPGELAYRELATRCVTTACKLVRVTRGNQRVPLEEEFTFQVVSAIGEAFNNVALHGYADGARGTITFEISTNDDCLVIDVVDFGQSFDPSDAPEPDLGALPESGMGLFIVRAFADELSYTKGSPNCLRMVKRFESWGHRAGKGMTEPR